MDSEKTAVRTAQARIAHSDIPIPKDRGRGVPRPPGPGVMQAHRSFLSPTTAPWFFAELAQQYPTLAHVKVMGMHRYVVSSPELIVDVFVNHAHDCVKGPAFDASKAFVGNGLLTSEGDVHLAHRRLVQPAFHPDRIAEYSQAMVEYARQRDASWSEGAQVDMSVEMSQLTLMIVGRTLFNVDVSTSAADVGQALRETLHAVSRYAAFGPALWRYPSPARRRAVAAMSTMDNVVNRIIDEHRTTGGDPDMLSLLLDAQEDGTGFTDAQVRDEVITLVLAGHETTAMLLTWTWMLLAEHPDLAEWMHEELDDVLGGREPTMDDMASLPRTRAIVAESLRLYPPVWIYGRRLVNDIELDGWTIPAGANVMASPFSMQRNPKWWDGPERFTPSRWLDEAGAYSERVPDVPRGVWAPFGWGSRKCIGEQFAWTEAVLILATLARDWAPQLASGARIRPESAVTLRPSGGMPMVLRRRAS